MSPIRTTDRTHSPDGSKTVSETVRLHREWLDDQPSTVRCAHCPDWSFSGTAAEARAASADHRGSVHPEFTNGRRHTKAEKIKAARQARTDREATDREARAVKRRQRELNETGESSHGDRHTLELEEPPDALGPAGGSSSTRTHDQEDDTMAQPSSPTKTAILALLDGETTTKDIAAAAGKSYAAVNTALQQMLKSGIVTRVRRGVYAAAGAQAALIVPPPGPEPEHKPERKIEIVLLPQKGAALEHVSPLVRLLSKLATEDLEAAAGDLEQLQRRLAAEHALVTEAIDTKAA